MAGRYATALFELAKGSGKLEDVAKDLDEFDKMLTESDDLRRLVSSPIFSAVEQQSAIDKIMKKAGASDLVANFFSLIAKNRRLSAITDMTRAFRALHSREKGEVEAEVISARALSDAQIEQLKSTLKSVVGQDVELRTDVDPSLLGGLVVKVGSRMIDSSLETKLNNLETTMKEVG